MGIGDNLMASGMARGAAARGRRIAFGNGERIIWDSNSGLIFRNNPNVAKPGTEDAGDLEWITFYKGHRLYNRQVGDRWEWNYDFRAQPGEIFLDRIERRFAMLYPSGSVIIEPNVPAHKSVAPNKDWGPARYDRLAERLRRARFDVVQLVYAKAGHRIPAARAIGTPSFRHAMAMLARAKLYIGPEGGLHHAAAAVGIAGVVIFGGFIPPQVTGYETHTNLTGGAEACGSLTACTHCRAAMDKITVEEVEQAAMRHLKVAA